MKTSIKYYINKLKIKNVFDKYKNKVINKINKSNVSIMLFNKPNPNFEFDLFK